MGLLPNKDLVTQTEADYINLGLDVGVYFGDRKEFGKTHTIWTWQSLNIIEKRFRDGESEMSLDEFAYWLPNQWKSFQAQFIRWSSY